MTEFATKEELQAVIDDLNDRLRKQHVINRTMAMTVNEILMNSAASTMILKQIVTLVPFPEDRTKEQEDVRKIAKDFLQESPARQEKLCMLLIRALTSDPEGMEEELRETFSRES
ncbi:MAG: hypothetical protein RSG92_24405 [Pseudomonas sp.]